MIRTVGRCGPVCSLLTPRRRTLQPRPLWSRVRWSPTRLSPASPQTYTEFGGFKTGKPGGITPRTRYMLSMPTVQCAGHGLGRDNETGLSPGVPAPSVGARPHQSERLEEGVVVGRCTQRARGRGERIRADQIRAGQIRTGRVRADRIRACRVIVAHGDGCLPARLAPRVDIEDRDAVAGRGVAPRGPGRHLHRVGGGLLS